jgi:hypothetical protein
MKNVKTTHLLLSLLLSSFVLHEQEARSGGLYRQGEIQNDPLRLQVKGKPDLQ